jgi:predicted O-methyltransferase YrrM
LSSYPNAACEQLVKIDDNHARFVEALVMSAKPRRLLEFGFGAGEATRAIQAGLAYNNQAHEYVVVDNWLDFGDERPSVTRGEAFGGITFITSAEYDFVRDCNVDFILSDADHQNTQLWFDQVYTRLLAPGGVLIYHDVTNTRDFPNLLHIHEQVIRNDHHHVLLNRNSRRGERCDRGLLVIFKH